MKRNFDTIVLDMAGVPFNDGDKSTPELKIPLSMKSVAIAVLMGMHEADKNIGGEEKLKRYLLATKINAGGEIELTAEEVTELKRLVGRGWPTPIVGPAYEFFEKDEA
jgi:hypothetical protein